MLESGLVHAVSEGFTGEQAGQIVDEQAVGPFDGRCGGGSDVRGQGNFRVLPEPVAGGQGLGLDHIESGMADDTAVEGVEQGRFVNQAAAGDIDEDGVGFHGGEGGSIDHVPRFVGQWGGEDDAIDLRQAVNQRVRMVDLCGAIGGAGSSAQARDMGAKGSEALAGFLADCAVADDQPPAAGDLAEGDAFPGLAGLLGPAQSAVLEVVEGGPEDPFGDGWALFVAGSVVVGLGADGLEHRVFDARSARLHPTDMGSLEDSPGEGRHRGAEERIGVCEHEVVALARLGRTAIGGGEGAVIIDTNRLQGGSQCLEPGLDAREGGAMAQKRLHASGLRRGGSARPVRLRALSMALVVGLSNPVLVSPVAAQQDVPLPTRSQDYLRDAITLAGILGSAHGVRFVCHGDGDQYWRQHMMDLLAMEAPERGSLRDSMVRAFNNSFTRMRERYRRCTDQVREEEALYAAEGRDLANKMAASYFPRPAR